MHPTQQGAEPPGDELELVARARKGEQEAFEQLLNRYQARITRLVFSILKDLMDTEEVVQDVFLTAFEKLDQFRGDSRFSTWVHRIAVNAALMRKRRGRTGVEVPLEELMPAFDDRGHIAVSVADWTEQADDPVLRQEARAVIQEAVAGLDDKYQTVFLLRDVEGLSTEETASALGLGVPAVKSRLHRARLFLRRELSRYFEKAEN